MKDDNKVDELITAIPGEWKFDAQVVAKFDEYVSKSVPLYYEFQSMIVEMSEWFIRDNSVVFDIGSSTGETISQLIKKHERKVNLKFVGVDNSNSMIEAANIKCPQENVEFILDDVTTMETFPKADFIVSLYTLQFLRLAERRKLLEKVYETLPEGGAFILVEKIKAEHSFLDDIWRELNWDYKSKQGLSDEMILQKARSLRGVLIPLTLTQNKELLIQIGFSEVDVFAKQFNFAGIIAVKPIKT